MTDNIIEIQYKDKRNWVSVNGIKTVNWDNYSKKYKNQRLQPYYVAPVVVPDSWNGKEHPVQHTTWTSYYFEMFLKESEIHELNKLKSCSDIQIIEYSRTSAGLIINKTYILDLSSPDMLIISEPERISTTTSQKVSVIFRVDRTVVNKGASILNTNELKFTTAGWELLTESTSLAGTNIIAALTESRMASVNAGVLRVYDYSLGVWTQTGNAFSTGYTTQGVAIVSLNIDSVAIFVDTDDKLEKYTFNGSDWSLTGASFSIASAKVDPVIAKLTNASVAIMDGTHKNLETYTFAGATWTKTGNSFPITIATAGTISISGLNATSIVYTDSVNSEIRIYDWDGTDWTLDFATAIVVGDNILLTALSATTIAYIDVDNLTLKQYTSTGAAWNETNTTLTLTGSGYNSLSTLDSGTIVTSAGAFIRRWEALSYTQLGVSVKYAVAALTGTRIATVSWGAAPSGVIQAYDYVSGAWVAVGNPFTTEVTDTGMKDICKLASAGTAIAYVTSTNKLIKYTFDGTNWTKSGNTLSIPVSGSYNKISYLTDDNIYMYSEGSDELSQYYISAGTWTLRGTPLIIAADTGSSPVISRLSTVAVIYIDAVNKLLSHYSWNGAIFSLDFSTSVGVGSNIIISDIFYGVGTTEIALIDSDNNLLYRFEIVGSSFVQKGDSLALLNGNYISMDYLGYLYDGDSWGANIIVFDDLNKRLNQYSTEELYFNRYSNFETGSFSYFSDFDVIGWNKPTENTTVEWNNKTIRLAQTINKPGYQFLLYLSQAELEVFMDNYKSSADISINGTSVTEVEIEPIQIANDYMKIILRGVSSVDITDFDICPLSTYNLRIVKDAVTYNFYTDYPPELISVTPDIKRLTNETGVATPTKNISKTVKKVKFYLTEDEAFLLKLRFELFGTVTLDAVPVLEAGNVKPNKIGVDLYEVEVDCLIAATLKH